MSRWMLREQSYIQLVANHYKQEKVKGTAREIDFEPAAKLWIPGTDCLWLLTELNPTDEIAFGLCQIQMAELGSCWMPELADLDLSGLRVVEDTSFEATRTLSGYARMSRANGWILTI